MHAPHQQTTQKDLHEMPLPVKFSPQCHRNVVPAVHPRTSLATGMHQMKPTPKTPQMLGHQNDEAAGEADVDLVVEGGEDLEEDHLVFHRFPWTRKATW